MNNFKEFLRASWLLIFCLILARFLGLPANFTPILACAAFTPFLTENKILQRFLPLGILLVTDPFLGLYSEMPVVYLCILLTSIIAGSFQNYNFKNLIFTGLMGVGTWHLLVNFAVWYSGHSTNDLFNTYILAMPFDFRLLLSTLFFSLFFYSLRNVFGKWYSRLGSN